MNVCHHLHHTLTHSPTRSLQGEGFSYEVPTRSATNQLYIAELDRIVLSDKVGGHKGKRAESRRTRKHTHVNTHT